MSITAAALPARQRVSFERSSGCSVSGHSVPGHSVPGHSVPGYSVVVPPRLAAPRSAQPATSVVYIRRRMLVMFMAVAVVAVVWLGAGSVVANRGGDPASASAVRPTATYVVQPGDTLWSIASIHRGAHEQVEYVDMLIAANGGASIAPGQGLVLP